MASSAIFILALLLGWKFLVSKPKFTTLEQSFSYSPYLWVITRGTRGTKGTRGTSGEEYPVKNPPGFY